MSEDILANPNIQYGFAGLCVVLLGFLAWLVKQLIALLQKTTEVINKNTMVIQSLRDESGEVKTLIIELKDKLISRPCIAKRES